MVPSRKTWIWIAAGVIAGVVTARLIYTYRTRIRPIVFTGAVIRKDSDPRKQVPIANANITVADGTEGESAKSDASGLFKMSVHRFLLIRNRPITLRFEHAGYQPAEISASASKNELYVVRMEPLPGKAVAEPDHAQGAAKPVQISHVRLRYTIKNQTTLEVGSVVKQFDVVNTGDVPCRGQRPCSPDGKWKASGGGVSLDAGKGNEFRNVRASCIAGPCPFTSVGTGDLSRPARKIEVTALDWSDTASFLVEAEVTSTRTTDQVRQGYSFIIGPTMSFALPASAEGPSILADVNGEDIVFPLGPALMVSWTTCSVEVAQGGNKVYRCELKPGYQFPAQE